MGLAKKPLNKSMRVILWFWIAGFLVAPFQTTFKVLSLSWKADGGLTMEAKHICFGAIPIRGALSGISTTNKKPEKVAWAQLKT